MLIVLFFVIINKFDDILLKNTFVDKNGHFKNVLQVFMKQIITSTLKKKMLTYEMYETVLLLGVQVRGRFISNIIIHCRNT